MNHILKKYKKQSYRYIKQTNYEKALALLQISSNVNYLMNQVYIDEEIEAMLASIRFESQERLETIIPDKQTVLFYDGFGLDTRGWAASYVRAINKLEYRLIYVTKKSSEGNIRHLVSEITNPESKIIYIDTDLSYIKHIDELAEVFCTYKPQTAFFYTTPHDVSATVVFNHAHFVNRIQIDLTDHAYWIGVHAMDYAIECREMGASIAVYERNISKDKILKLDCTPYVLRESNKAPFPFDITKEKYIFTGGALYKTLGDPELKYYKTIDYILEKYTDIKFLYAGSGDSSQIEVLRKKYADRVFLIDERQDFYDIMENAVLYINSYPMFGGLMMRYAALAGKIPITLKHDNDADGILINQNSLNIEFEDYQEYLSEIDRLLTDEEYRECREKNIRLAVIDEDTFTKNVESIIISQSTEFSFQKIDKFDTTMFRKEFENRFSKKEMYKLFILPRNRKLLLKYPLETVLGFIYKVEDKIQFK